MTRCWKSSQRAERGNKPAQFLDNLDSRKSRKLVAFGFLFLCARQGADLGGERPLGLQVIRKARIPLRTLSEQRCIAAKLDSVHSHMYALKTLQAGTAVELDALLPSILDQAFKGEL